MQIIPEVQFGEPIADLPKKYSGAQPASHWVAVAEYCKQRPNLWHPVKVEHLNLKAHKNAARSINTHEYASFRTNEWAAAFRGETLFVRYTTPASALKAVNQ